MLTLQDMRRRMPGTGIGRLLRRLGVGRLALTAYERWVMSRGMHSTVVLGESVTMLATSPGAVFAIDYFAQEEGGLLQRLIDAVQDTDIVFDIGANIGLMSILLAKHRHGAIIHAFEPNPHTAANLRTNIARNQCGSQVHVHEVALGRAEGNVHLYTHAANAACGTDSIISGIERNAGGDAFEVAVTRGDVFCAGKSLAPAILKIDVEGAELDVLSGFGDVLGSMQLKHVLVEVHPRLLGLAGATEKEVVDLLLSSGFHIVHKAARGGEQHYHFCR